jgi:hypothetical protein
MIVGAVTVVPFTWTPPCVLHQHRTTYKNQYPDTLLLKKAVLRIRDVYPGSRILIFTHPGSRIPDLGSRIQKQQQKRGVKKMCCHTIFCSHKFHKIENYFIFEMLKKILWANFQIIIEFFTQKIVNKLSKIWVWDPGSGIGLGQNGIGFRIPDPDPQH